MSNLQKKLHKEGENLLFEISAISEWDVRAVMAYASIHHQLKFNEKLVHKYQKEFNKLKESTWSLNSKKASKMQSKKTDFKSLLMAANEKSHNLGDITQIEGQKLVQEKIDFITYSFPCQGLSSANMGRSLGINNKDSTSHLVWEIKRILDGMKKRMPKYLLLENVPALTNKYKPEYEQWVQTLKSYGYRTFTALLDSKNFGSLQKRRRVFAVSFLDPKQKLPLPFKNDEQFKEYLIHHYGIKNPKISKHYESQAWKKQQFNKIMDFNDSYHDEYEEARIRNTKSRLRLIDGKNWINKNNDFYFNTITTKQDRNPNAGIIACKNKTQDERYLNYRFFTPRELIQIMGFEKSDFNGLRDLQKKNFLTKESLYRFAGNSIVVNVLEAIFEFLNDFEKGIRKEKDERK